VKEEIADFIESPALKEAAVRNGKHLIIGHIQEWPELWGSPDSDNRKMSAETIHNARICKAI
jgi:hypothetical protein